MVAIVKITNAPALSAELTVDYLFVKRKIGSVPLCNPDRKLAGPLVDPDYIVVAVTVPVTNVEGSAVHARLQGTNNVAPDAAANVATRVVLGVLVREYVNDTIGGNPDVVVHSAISHITPVSTVTFQ